LLAEISLWSADLADLAADVSRIDPFADIYHIDVADGRFAPSFLFFPDLVARLRRLTAKPFHVHLMVEADVLAAQTDAFLEAGADIVSVHAECGEAASAAIARVRAAGRTPGVVLRLETPVESIAPHVREVGFVTLLGTAIGVKGQGLAPEATDRLMEAARMIAAAGRSAEVTLAADGGIREETVPRLRAAGAHTVVMGSLAFGAQDLAARFAWLKSL
jgi:ribulose-phosphate 3-epimerase